MQTARLHKLAQVSLPQSYSMLLITVQMLNGQERLGLPQLEVSVIGKQYTPDPVHTSKLIAVHL